MDLRAVREPSSLLWPDGFPNRFRGDYGGRKNKVVDKRLETVNVDPYIVDLDATLEREYFCLKQEHKLRKLSADEAKRWTAPSPIVDPVALAAIRKRQKTPDEPKPVAVGAALSGGAAGAAQWSADAPEVASIPVPDSVKRGKPAGVK